MNLTNDILSCPYPNSNRSRILLTNMRDKICDSFLYLSSIVLGKMDLNYDMLTEDINKYRNYDYPLSIISAFHERLIAHMKNGNTEKIRDLFKEFETIHVKRKAFSLIAHNTPHQSLSLKGQQIIYDVCKNSFDSTYNKPFVFNAPSISSMLIFETALYKALEAVNTLDNLLFLELSTILDYIWVVKTKQMNAGVSFPTYGIVFIREITKKEHWTRILEHLVHEADVAILFRTKFFK